MDGNQVVTPSDSQASQLQKSKITTDIVKKNDVKTKYYFGTTWFLYFFVLIPIGITLVSLKLFVYVDMNPEYFTLNFLLGTIFSLYLLGAVVSWLTSSFILIIIKNHKSILIGIGRLNIITPSNVDYFEKTQPRVGPNRRSEPDHSIQNIVLMNGKRIPIFALSISPERQRRIENALIGSIGAPIKEPRYE